MLTSASTSACAVERRQLGGRHVAAQPQRHPAALGERAQLHVERAGAAQLELGLARREARPRRTPRSAGRGSCPARAARSTAPAPAPSPATGARAAPHRRRGRRSGCSPRSARAATPMRSSRSTPCELNTTKPSTRGASSAVNAALQPRQHRIAPGSELAHDHEPPPLPAAPGQSAPGCRAVLRAHHDLGIGPRKSPPEAAREHQRRAAGAPTLPGAQDLVLVAARCAKPVLALIPARLAHRPGRSTRGAIRPRSASRSKSGSRYGTGTGARMAQRHRHTATLPQRLGRKRLAMAQTRAEVRAEPDPRGAFACSRAAPHRFASLRAAAPVEEFSHCDSSRTNICSCWARSRCSRCRLPRRRTP